MESQRLDKWLWAARFFKTRSLAGAAISGGKVHVDGQRVKPARAVRPGAMVRIRKLNFEMTVEILALSQQRGPAPLAQALYRETLDSEQQRQRASEQRKMEAAEAMPPSKRPSKRERRQIHRFRNRHSAGES